MLAYVLRRARGAETGAATAAQGWCLHRPQPAAPLARMRGAVQIPFNWQTEATPHRLELCQASPQ
jgi:hypothetical protein